MRSPGTQARLPATLPDPRQARANLTTARQEARDKRAVVDGLKERAAAARDEIADAMLDLEAAEEDLLGTAEGSREHLAAQDKHGKAWRRLARARKDAEKVKATRKLAKDEAKAAEGKLVAAREDLEAIRQGRREP